jgi:hypothetical protein
MWKRIRRQVSIGNGLHFNYEISPHRAFLAKKSKKVRTTNASAVCSETSSPTDESSMPLPSVPADMMDPVPTQTVAERSATIFRLNNFA